MQAQDWAALFNHHVNSGGSPVVRDSKEGTLRYKALKKLNTEGLPHKKMEVWRHSPLSILLQSEFCLHKEQNKMEPELSGLPFCQELIKDATSKTIVLHNGILDVQSVRQFNDEVEGIEIIPASQLEQKVPAHIYEKFITEVENNSYNFSLLNTLFHQDFPVIIVKNEKKNFRRLNLVHLANAQPMTVLFPKCWILMLEGAETEIMEVFYSQTKTPFWFNASTHIWVSEKASLNYIRMQSQHENSYIYHYANAFVQKEAALNSLSLSVGASFDRHDFFVFLQGERAKADLKGLYTCTSKEVADHHTILRHEVPNTYSEQYYKGILHDQGHGIFNGRIDILKNANGCVSKQLNKNLILSDTARVDTKPELNILNNDVKCSHGATVGQLNPDEKFYLESRGIPAHQATIMLAHGFLDDIFDRFTDSEIKPILEPFLSRFYKNLDCLEL